MRENSRSDKHVRIHIEATSLDEARMIADGVFKGQKESPRDHISVFDPDFLSVAPRRERR